MARRTKRQNTRQAATSTSSTGTGNQLRDTRHPISKTREELKQECYEMMRQFWQDRLDFITRNPIRNITDFKKLVLRSKTDSTIRDYIDCGPEYDGWLTLLYYGEERVLGESDGNVNRQFAERSYLLMSLQGAEFCPWGPPENRDMKWPKWKLGPDDDFGSFSGKRMGKRRY
ncbi:hypothetical protein BJ508DRAFT_340323 [Ascobolus immersus RN42]|uniref:Uncharacterized protein n=1 Tax=Ascobolus immersus RN42 TaxID=1160509 RepID=A0A3N4IDW8_ASCIM|nr:hypothetical protein BJ508DRAFT_340323 [Ascobolus immersus RN42]